MAARRTFGRGVKIGNWSEDRAEQEERVRQFLEREKEGNLSFQKTELFIGASTAPVELTQATKGTLSIGDTVLVQHVGSGKTLSVLEGEPTASVTASPSALPTLRNAFTVDSMQGAEAGSAVRYGDKVAFRCATPSGQTLYLASDRSGPHSIVAHLSGEQRVYTVTVADGDPVSFACAWVVDAHDATVRPESMGSPVPTGASVIIRHSNSAECLACLHELHKTYLTTFGPETEVTCSTKKAGMAMGEFVVKEENEWSFVSS